MYGGKYDLFRHISLLAIILIALTLLIWPSIQAPAAAQASPPGVSAADHLVPMDANYVGNAKSMKFHYPDCRWAQKISPANRVYFETREEAIEAGYTPCKVCRP